MDCSGTGLTLISTGFQLWISLLIFLLGVTSTLFFKTEDKFTKWVCGILSVVAFVVIGIMATNFVNMGTIYSNNENQQAQKSQIININLSCINSNNCSASIPNYLQISCPEQNCSPQIICPEQIPIPKPTSPPLKIISCPWSLSLP